MWTHNVSWGLGGSMGGGGGKGAWEETSWVGVVGAGLAVVGVVTVVLNVLLLCAILLHPPARSRCFHVHIANMAAAALVQGGGVLPLWAHYLMHGAWLHGDSVCRWWLAADTIATSVMSLALVLTACDRFIYLICWRFVREGGKYIICFLFIFLSWLAALTLTLTLTFMDADEARGGGHIGVQGAGGLCSWGPVRVERLVAARLIIYSLGAGLGTGLCLALFLLPCLGRGDLLPIDEDEGELAVRKRSLKAQNKRRTSKTPAGLTDEALAGETPLNRQYPQPHVSWDSRGIEDIDEEDEDFPRFLMVPKTDRLEERDRWKWQVASLLTVTAAWALLWLPSHLFIFAHKLGLAEEWPLLSQPTSLLVSLVLGYAHAVLMPPLWLLHQPIRKALVALIFCRCCRRDEGEDENLDDSMEFQDGGHCYRPTPLDGSPAKKQKL